jgi:hypothetical protein
VSNRKIVYIEKFAIIQLEQAGGIISKIAHITEDLKFERYVADIIVLVHTALRDGQDQEDPQRRMANAWNKYRTVFVESARPKQSSASGMMVLGKFDMQLEKLYVGTYCNIPNFKNHRFREAISILPFVSKLTKTVYSAFYVVPKRVAADDKNAFYHWFYVDILGAARTKAVKDNHRIMTLGDSNMTHHFRNFAEFLYSPEIGVTKFEAKCPKNEESVRKSEVANVSTIRNDFLSLLEVVGVSDSGPMRTPRSVNSGKLTRSTGPCSFCRR